ncbi:hydroxymethylglutaryl-CoA lyase [Conexibacter sp. JD483]|uniref:hydroxymethylglutaryl-CoA lyase n=1 Tax=unclassified Conexibacter TaxID=2627773 RepID=UPI00271E5838|nr:MULTISPECIES: hydroxymethylglutaryl-CoA lyase [unclassified Conexibacter]MDO8186044.1 hydroxymethylglutaryl-CoA lyase [Conexibacter sp. CPCC 205706]MDO8199534.1 hydroxymethylglutaryl-CoA lyase [Conexibacter sp. CPCC 205762]MDR9368931.1 hydroxymethylglutaryl-CoA lyase [Conexibacter sp. JD483]
MLLPGLPAAVRIRDVGPRDGLQSEAPLPVSLRVALVRRLAAAGVREIEVGAFVSPKAVPAMAGAAEVLAELDDLDGVERVALVPNLRGARDAVAAGADALTCTISASPEYNRRNVGMTIDESLAQIEQIGALAAPSLDVVISCAFGSPYEGEIAVAEVARISAAARARGATRITLADTTGMGTPRGVAELLDTLGPAVGMHLHETRNTALVCAYEALRRGVTRFDSALGGLGGSPFATGAAGNLATEDLVNLLDDLGVASGISLPRLLTASRELEAAVGRPLPSAVARSGPRLAA